MNQRRIIFYSIFGVYQLAAFIFTLIMESDTGFLFKIVNYITWFKYITFFGLVLIILDFAWWWIDGRNTKKEHDSMRHENNTLKAKVYDMQESTKETKSVSPK
ncbi:MAG: hypothetical protein ACOYW3_01760 [Bacteroidota bacterium]